MSGNEERLKDLESGNERPPAKANPPVTNQGSASNDDKLGQLQSGASAWTQSTAPVTSQFSSGATPAPPQSPKPPNPLHGGRWTDQSQWDELVVSERASGNMHVDDSTIMILDLISEQIQSQVLS